MAKSKVKAKPKKKAAPKKKVTIEKALEESKKIQERLDKLERCTFSSRSCTASNGSARDEKGNEIGIKLYEEHRKAV